MRREIVNLINHIGQSDSNETCCHDVILECQYLKVNR